MGWEIYIESPRTKPRGSFIPFTSPFDCWAIWPPDFLTTRWIHQHRCWSKPALSNHRVFQCWDDLPTSQHNDFGRCRPPAQMHWDVTEAGRCSLWVVQRWCDLNTCDLEAFSMKAVFFWAVSMNQEDNKGKYFLLGLGEEDKIKPC